jgi:hypothetical protein
MNVGFLVDFLEFSTIKEYNCFVVSILLEYIS